MRILFVKILMYFFDFLSRFILKSINQHVVLVIFIIRFMSLSGVTLEVFDICPAKRLVLSYDMTNCVVIYLVLFYQLLYWHIVGLVIIYNRYSVIVIHSFVTLLVPLSLADLSGSFYNLNYFLLLGVAYLIFHF